MEWFIAYNIKCFLNLGIFYGLYWVLFRNSMNFRFSRFYLLFSLLLSFVLPLIQLQAAPSDSIVSVYILDTVKIAPDYLQQTVQQSASGLTVLTLVYILISTVFLIRFIYQNYKLKKLAVKSKTVMKNGIRHHIIAENYPAFSYLNNVYINHNDYKSTNADCILAHEYTHLAMKHSLDLIIVELLIVFQWFNPALWMYKKSLKEVHEFQVDEELLCKAYQKANYQRVLAEMMFGFSPVSVSNSFSSSLLKRRYNMMSKDNVKRTFSFSYYFLIPAALLVVGFNLLIACSEPAVVSSEAESTNEMIDDEADIKIHDFKGVEVKPEFPGGDQELLKYLASETKYPEESRKNGVEGKVYVEFVIDNDGSVTDVRVAEKADPLLDEEALRVVSSMPKWKPGMLKGKAVKVQYLIPLNFKLGDKAEETD